MDQEIREFISRTLASNNTDRFPGPQPISLERRHLEYISNNPYMVCEKTDGIRHFLVCFTDSQHRKICALVNRKMESVLYSLTVPRDTILDGELFENTFVVHDAIIIRGEYVGHMHLTERLARARKMVAAIVPTARLYVKVKLMVSMSDIASIRIDPRTTDGLIFTPIEEPTRMGTHRTLFKWKPVENITMDFIIQGGKYLCIQHENNYQRIQMVTGGGHWNDGTILECSYSGSWIPLKERTDKSHPNNKRTLERTLVNIREKITLCELTRIFGTTTP